jgi:hypothetical protein
MARPCFHVLARFASLASAALAVAVVLGGPSRAAADGPEPGAGGLRASMACDRVPEPGRVRCTVEARALEGWALAWSDLVVLDVPEFASPLKARVVGEVRPPGVASFAFALVARRTGRADARVRVRGVSCARIADGGVATERCVPVALEVRAEIVVGG